MPRSDRDRDRKRSRAPKDAGRRVKKRVCIFCQQASPWVDYKDVGTLRKFMSDRGKIRARRVSGNCAQHQREVAVAIKTARELALLPYTQRSASERGGRGRREDRPGRGPGRSERGPERDGPAPGEGTGERSGGAEESQAGAGESQGDGGADGGADGGGADRADGGGEGAEANGSERVAVEAGDQP